MMTTCRGAGPASNAGFRLAFEVYVQEKAGRLIELSQRNGVKSG